MSIRVPDWPPRLLCAAEIGLVLFLFAVDRGVAQSVMPAAKTLTVEKRLQALEDKTDFFVKTTKKISKTYTKGRAGSAAWACTSGRMTLVVDPKITLSGTSYSWTTATIKFAGALGPDPGMEFSFWVAGKENKTCDMFTEIEASNTPKSYKKFCTLEFEARDKYQFAIDIFNSEEETLRACDYVTSVDLELKVVNMGIEEPK